MNEHRDTLSSLTTQGPELGAEPARMNASRRRLLRGGLAAAPAILALKTTPALACACKLPSGFSVSGNQSVKGGAGCDKPTNLPSAWRTALTTTTPKCFSGTAVQPTARFDSLKPGGVGFTTNPTYTAARTLDACLSRGAADPQAMIVAVYLQSLVNAGSQFPLPTVVREIWNKGVIGGAYYPTSATSPVWDSANSIKYLRYLTGQIPG